MKSTSTLPVPLSIENIDDYELLEFLLLMGPGGSGKSHNILELAQAWKRVMPGGIVYCIDAETGLAKEYKLKYSHLDNIRIWHGEHTADIWKFLEVFHGLKPLLTTKDWLCIESDTKIWSYAQDAGYRQVTGMSKDEYLSDRLDKAREGQTKVGGVTPDPENLWQVVGDLYRRRFRDVLTSEIRLRTNVLITTGFNIEGHRKNAARRMSMDLLGLTGVVADGHAEVTRNPDTVIALSREKDSYMAQVVKDRGVDRPGLVLKFPVESFYLDLMDARNQEE
ncbi:MAG: hypothetical protein M0R06_04720 [Sphaerochaeta sp.]|jgi:energy-coupling factor transporter ATP-binding protein EcfA2|nr:hypothetical protein [Sphaerochaeta sp.]